MFNHLRPALVLFVLLTVITGLIYPLAITGFAQVLFPHQANGSLVSNNGHVIGSTLIGQDFTGDQYFHGRLSATTDTDPNDPAKTVAAPYNAASSVGSNLGPTSKALMDRIRADSQKLRPGNTGDPIPADLVTTSASGLDPHISPEAALFQVKRIAGSRGMDEEQLKSLVSAHTQGRWLGILGEPVVNVLDLNIALDAGRKP